MIIHPPQLTRTPQATRVAARVEFDRARRGVPNELWFEFTSEHAPSTHADPFVVALLLVAMQAREDIHVRGSLSRKLHAGLTEYQKVFNRWFPDRFYPVQIHADSLREDDPTGAGIACAFSGGVDSFYSLFILQNARAPLTDALFIAGGFDMPAAEASSVQSLSESYLSLARELGLRLTLAHTNVRSFVDTVDWTNAHGSVLIAAALFFSHAWRSFAVPSSYVAGKSPKWGTHPELDPHLSTESLRIEHHGTAANRVQKLQAIVQRPESYARLRVCWIQNIGLSNCGTCEKCVRTRIALSLLGALSRYTTFQSSQLHSAEIRSLTLRTHQSRVFAADLCWQALRLGRVDIALSIAWAFAARAFRRIKRG